MSSLGHAEKEQKTGRKNALVDDFFEISSDRPFAHPAMHLFAGIICVVFAWWLWMLNPLPEIHPDQMNIVTMVLSKAHPDNFAKDPTWSGGRAADFYPPLPQLIIAGFIKKYGIIGGHRVLQFPLSIAYLLIMYGTLYYLTRSVPAALLVSLASIIWRWSFAETYWGLDRLQAVQPRSFVIIFTPLLFVLFWKWRKSRKLLIPFFIAGLVFNLNPPSAMCFVLVSWSALLLLFLFDRTEAPNLRQSILRLIAAAAAFVAGALPYIYTNITAEALSTAQLSPAQMQQYWQALQYRYTQIGFLPIPSHLLAKSLMFGFAVPMLLAAFAWCLRAGKRNSFDKWLLWFFLVAFIGTVIAQYLLQQLYIAMRTFPFLDNLMRGQRYVYLVLYIYIACLLADVLSRLDLRDKCVLITVAALVVAIMPPFENNSRNPFGQWQHNAAQAEKLLQGRKIESAGWHNRLTELCSWARQKTPTDSLFIFAHSFMSPFRIYALRSMVSSQTDGCFSRHNGPMGIVDWASYQQQLRKIVAFKDVSLLLKLAERSQADYIVVPADFPEPINWTLAMRDRFWKVYKSP